MRSNPKDILVAFGAVMTIFTVWSAIDTFKSKQKTAERSKNLDKKLDLIISRLK